MIKIHKSTQQTISTYFPHVRDLQVLDIQGSVQVQTRDHTVDVSGGSLGQHQIVVQDASGARWEFEVEIEDMK